MVFFNKFLWGGSSISNVLLGKFCRKDFGVIFGNLV